MADPSPLLPTPPGSKKEMSLESRLLLALVLTGLVFYVSQFFYKPPPAPRATTPTSKTAAAVTEKPAEAAVAPAAIASAPSVGQVQAAALQTFDIDTDLYRIHFVNKGAVVTSWMLKKFVDHSGKPLELVNPSSFGKVAPPFALVFPNQQPTTDLNSALYAAHPTADGLGIDYEFSDGKTVARKSFHFGRNSYLSELSTEVSTNGAPLPHLVAWRGGFGDATVQNRASVQHSVYYDVNANKLRKKDAKAAKNGPVTERGNYSFAGMEDTFFAAVFLPPGNNTEFITSSDTVLTAPQGKEEAHVGSEVGGAAQNRFSLFVGPKDIDILRRVDPKLEQVIDWGYFGIVAKPLFLVLNLLNDRYIHNYGWTIIVLTILINLVLLPLRFSSLKSSKKMQALQPHIKAINEKYKNVKMNDPRKQEQNQEVMDLYKKHGANPVGGCLPMVIQLPILFAFLTVLSVTIEMRGAHWLWVGDLSQPESLAIKILPTLLIVTQFLNQRMTPNPGMDPAQQKLMLIMPLGFGFFFYFQAAGLVLYWLTGNLVGILQQYAINRMTKAPDIPAPPAVTKKKTRN